MIKTGKISVVFISILFSVQQAMAAISVQSRVDRTEMGLGDTVTVTVSVSADKSVDVTEPRIPGLDGFDLVNSWSSQGRSTKLIQGTAGMEFQTMTNYDYNFMITPQKQGRLSVPAFELVVDGKTYYTQPIVINVSAEGSGAGIAPPGMPAQPSMMDEEEEIFNQLLRRGGAFGGGNVPGRQGQQPNAGSAGRGMQDPSVRTLPKNMNEAFFIQVEVDKTDVYEGEQVLVNWYIYTRGNLLSLDRLKFPDLKGFWKEIIEEVPALNFTEEFINNVRYKKALLASHALFPIKAGTATIDEYKIKSTAQLPTSPYGAFGFGPPYTYTKTSERVKINVKALPREGRPSDFAGAVGNFEVRAQVENSNQNAGGLSPQTAQFPVNQPFALKIRFEGTGNAKLIELPPLNLPAHLELYDTKAESKFFRNGKSYKEFEVLVIPRQEGDVAIPAISFSQFDPNTKKYESKKTSPINLKIVPGSGGGKLADNRLQAGAKQAPVVKKNELPPLLVSYEAKSTLPKLYSWTFWLSLYSVITLILLLKLRSELGFGKRKKDLQQIMNRRLRKVDQLIDKNDWRAVGVEMTNVIYQILGDISGQGGASVEITRLMDQAPPSLRREIGEDLNKAIEIFQVMSFAPEGVVGSLKDKAEMKKNVSFTQKILSRGIDLAEDRQGQSASQQMS